MPEGKEELYVEAGTIIASTSLAAMYFGVTAATLSNWMKAGCPRHKFGFWDIRAVSDWRAINEGKKLAEAAQKDPGKLAPKDQKTYYEALLKQEQLESAVLRNKIASGDYLAKAQIVEELSAYFLVLKQSVLGLAHEMGQMIAPYLDADGVRRMDRILSDRAVDALEQLSITGVYNAQDEGDTG